MKPLTFFLFLAIVTFPILYITACAPARVNYGVSVHAGPGWGNYHNHRRSHHRPSYRPHSRPSNKHHSRPPRKR